MSDLLSLPLMDHLWNLGMAIGLLTAVLGGLAIVLGILSGSGTQTTQTASGEWVTTTTATANSIMTRSLKRVLGKNRCC